MRDRSISTSTVICGHRGGGGDDGIVEALIGEKNASQIIDHYERRDLWANRKATFERMLSEGVRCFEFDLLLSKNNDVMVVHNSEINGRHVWDQTTDELEEAGCMKYSELLDLMERFQRSHRKQKITLLTELKGSKSSETTTDAGEGNMEPKVEELANKVSGIITTRVKQGKWNYDQIPVIGFNHKMLKQVQKNNPDIQVGLSFATENFGLYNVDPGMDDGTMAGAYNERIIEQIRKYQEQDDKGVVGKPVAAIVPDSRFVDPSLADAVHHEGLKLFSWSAYRIREKDDVMQMSDIWITDRPLAARDRLPPLEKGGYPAS